MIDINDRTSFTVMFRKDVSVNTKFIPAFTEVKHIGDVVDLHGSEDIIYLSYIDRMGNTVVKCDLREQFSQKIEAAQNKLAQEAMDEENQTAPGADEGNASQPATDDTGGDDDGVPTTPPPAADENKAEPAAADKGKKTGKWPFQKAK